MGRLEPDDLVLDQVRRSIRRTTSLHLYRSHATAGDVVIDGRGRDSVLGDDGVPRHVDARLLLHADFLSGRSVTAVTSEPSTPGLDKVVGHPTTKGFRQRLYDAVPSARGGGSLVMALLEDVPGVATMGQALFALDGEAELVASDVVPPVLDICSGWGRDTTYGRSVTAGIVVGLPETAPVREVSRTEGVAWSGYPPREGGQWRRLRRLDLTAGDDGRGSDIVIDAWFRDSLWRPPDEEGAVHEYALHVGVDSSTLRVTSCEAQPHVLPTWECEGAVSSAQRLVGRTLTDLREDVRRELHGVGTCTHLNEEMRSLGDAHALVGELARALA